MTNTAAGPGFEDREKFRLLLVKTGTKDIQLEDPSSSTAVLLSCVSLGREVGGSFCPEQASIPCCAA